MVVKWALSLGGPGTSEPPTFAVMNKVIVRPMATCWLEPGGGAASIRSRGASTSEIVSSRAVIKTITKATVPHKLKLCSVRAQD